MHLDDDNWRIVCALAELAGKSNSEFVRDLVMSEISRERAEFQAKAQIFNGQD